MPEAKHLDTKAPSAYNEERVIDAINQFSALHGKSERFTEGHCATFALGLARMLRDIGEEPELRILYRVETCPDSGEAEEVIFSHCVAAAGKHTFDITGGDGAEDRWMDRWPSTTETRWGDRDIEFWVESFALTQTQELEEAVRGGGSNFDRAESDLIARELTKLYFLSLTDIPKNLAAHAPQHGVGAGRCQGVMSQDAHVGIGAAHQHH